jgi:hypothetical protein
VSVLVATTAATTAVSTTTAAAVAAATAVATAATATTTTTATATIFTWASFVHGQCATLKFLAIHSFNSGIATVCHFDETKSSRTTGFSVHHYRRRSDVTEATKRFAQIVCGCAVSEIPDVQILTHSTLFLTGQAQRRAKLA